MSLQEDGRRRRSDRSKVAIVDACKVAMLMGVFRPTMVDLCKAAAVSVRTGFQHFDGIEAVWMAAIEDPAVSKAILTEIVRDSLFPAHADCDRIVKAAVFGRVT